MSHPVLEALQQGDLPAAIDAARSARLKKLLPSEGPRLVKHPEQLGTLLHMQFAYSHDADIQKLISTFCKASRFWLEPVTPLSTLRPSLRPLWSFKAHRTIVKSILILDDGRMVTVSEDGSMATWRDGDLIARTRPHGGKAINHIARAKDSFLTSSDDHTVKLWDAETLEERQTITGHTGYVSKATMARGVVVSVSADQTVGFNEQRLQRHKSWVYALEVSPDGGTVVTGSITGGMHRWYVRAPDVSTSMTKDQEALFPLKGDAQTYISPASADGYAKPNAFLWPTSDTLIGVGKDIGVWDTRTWTRTRTIAAHNWPVHSGVLADGGRLLITAGRVVKVWDLTAEQPQLASFVPHGNQQVHSLAVSSDGKTLFTGDQLGEVRCWDLATLLSTPSKDGHESSVITPMRFSEDGKRLLTGGNGDRSAILWSAEDGSVVHHWKDLHQKQFVNPVGITGTLAVTVAGNELCAMDIHRGHTTQRLIIGSRSGSIAASHLDEDVVVSTNVLAKNLKRADLSSGEIYEVPSALKHGTSVSRLGKSRLVWTCYRANQSCPVFVTHRQTGEEMVRLLPMHWQSVNPVRFNCATVIGDQIVAGGAGGLLCAWDAETGAQRRQIVLRGKTKPLSISAVWKLPGGQIAVLQSKPAALESSLQTSRRSTITFPPASFGMRTSMRKATCSSHGQRRTGSSSSRRSAARS